MHWQGSLSDSLAEIVRRTTNANEFAAAWLGWEPHTGQRKWLAAPEKDTNVLVTGRRWGKSEVAAVQALYAAVFRPKTRQGIVSVTLDQARLSYDVAIRFCHEQPLLEALVGRERDTPFPTIRLKTGSEITVRTAARGGIYLRGHRFDRVIIDEADYLPEKLIDEVIRMTLADTGGSLVLISTPGAKRRLVYRELARAKAGQPGVYAQTGSTFDNPHVNRAYIEGMRSRMTAAAWQREVEGIYAADDIAVFRWEDIQAAYENADWSLPLKPDKDKRWVAGWDLAKQEDWTVGYVLEATTRPYKLAYAERFQRQPWPAVAHRIREVHNRYGCQSTVIDATGIGEAVLDEVRDVAQGYVFTGRSKVDLLTNLQVALEKRELQFPFERQLVDELQGYSWDDDGMQTDCVMALALACWATGPRAGVEFGPSIWG